MSSESDGQPMCLWSVGFDQQNADLVGIAVVVTNVIVNFCLRIMVTWSPGGIDVGIQSLLIQFYPIILSALLSINRKQLSRFDVYFALRVSSSPLTIYLVVASIADLCGIRTGLYKRIKSYRPIIRALGASVLLIWTGLSMSLWMWASSFEDDACKGSWTFVNWIRSTMDVLSLSLMYPGGIIPLPGLEWVIIIPWFVCLARRWSQLRAGVKHRSEGASRLRVFYIWVKYAWCTIDRNHKWCIYFLFAYLDIGWAYQTIYLASLVFQYGYVLSYGQLLSVFVTVPTLVSTAKLVYFYRLNLLHFLQRLPRLCLAEAKYLSAGKEPGSTVQDTHLPFNIISHPERPVLGKSRDQIVMNIRSAHQPPRLPELDYAMRGGREPDTRFCASCATLMSGICEKV